MHVFQFLKLGHAAPPGGRLDFSKNTEFDCSDSTQYLKKHLSNQFEIFHQGALHDPILKIEEHALTRRVLSRAQDAPLAPCKVTCFILHCDHAKHHCLPSCYTGSRLLNGLTRPC